MTCGCVTLHATRSSQRKIIQIEVIKEKDSLIDAKTDNHIHVSHNTHTGVLCSDNDDKNLFPLQISE